MPPPSSGSHRAVNYWKLSKSSGRQQPWLLHLLLLLSAGDRTSAQTWLALSLLISSVFGAGALKITLQLKTTDSKGNLVDPNQHPLKPGEGTQRKWV